MSEPKKAIDWQGVRERLRESQFALDTALEHDPHQVAAAYRDRAARLALRPVPAGSAAAGTPALVFRLGAERYAIPLQDLAGVLPDPKCALVPGAPPQLAGVINLRGEIRPVWDLARLLDLPEAGNGASRFVVLLRQGGRETGLQVERLEQIRVVKAEEWEHPGERFPYLQGVTSDTLMILNTEALLQEEFR